MADEKAADPLISSIGSWSRTGPLEADEVDNLRAVIDDAKIITTRPTFDELWCPDFETSSAMRRC